jgi:PAS domain S-box-containing protein
LSVPIGAARDSLLSALRTAGRLADALRREQRRRQEIQYLIRYSSDAIISLKADHTIRSVNPSAEKALGHSAQELIGQNLLTLEGLGSAAALRKALDNSQPTYGIALQFARASFVANITPMIYEETREGSLVTMQEFAVIDDLDERVRKERRRRGYIAQARFAEFPSKSPAIQPVLREAEAYAPFDVPILITGEPRLPKSRLAECIHNASMRRRNPYVSVDLGTIPPENQFGLLFGQRGGGDIGLVGQAHKGTLFLLDVNLLSPDCQRQLLSILRYGNFRRKDSLEPIQVSVRVICSTFADLLDLARQDRFMWQLALTLHGISLPMPPIRETPEDIPAYLREYMDQSAQRFKKRVTLTDEAVVHLCRYPWKNNLRDIEYFAARATILAPGPVIGLDFVRELSRDVTVSLAHSCADYAQASAAFQAGARQCTHLWNAMPPLHHREPGVIGAAADRNDVRVELICDGIHSHPAIIRLTFRLFAGRVVMISDSMEATGLTDGTYQLGGQEVTVRGARATLASGTCTLNRVCMSVSPIPRAASTTAGSTSLMPVTKFRSSRY